MKAGVPRAAESPPSTELALHLATYRARPDVNAVVHLHPQSAVLLDALGEPIRLITTDHAFYLRRVARVAVRSARPAALAEARRPPSPTAPTA